MPEDLNSLLIENGYNPYSMPDRDFVPLAVVRQNQKKTFERVGLLSEFVEFPANAKKPDPVALSTERKSEFSSVFTAQVDASLGASLLKNIFAQIGETSASTKIKFDKVDKIELSYTNVLSDCVDPVRIAKYLTPPAAPPASDLVAGLLRPNYTFLIYDILKSNSFTVKCHAKEEAGSKTDVSMLKDIVKTDSTITITEESDTSLTFKGADFQTFALRIYPFWIRDKGGEKGFFFQPKPPSFFDAIGGMFTSPSRGMGGGDMAPKRERAPGKMRKDSYVLPEGYFYKV